jgi:hypothetical protein
VANEGADKRTLKVAHRSAHDTTYNFAELRAYAPAKHRAVAESYGIAIWQADHFANYGTHPDANFVAIFGANKPAKHVALQ